MNEIPTEMDTTFEDFDQAFRPMTRHFEPMVSEGDDNESNYKRRNSGQFSESESPFTKPLTSENISLRMSKSSGDKNVTRETRNSRPSEGPIHTLNTTSDQSETGAADKSTSQRKYINRSEEIHRPVPKQKSVPVEKEENKISRRIQGESKSAATAQPREKSREVPKRSETDSIPSAKTNPKSDAVKSQTFSRTIWGNRRGYPAPSTGQSVDPLGDKETHRRNHKDSGHYQRNRKPRPKEPEDLSEQSDASGQDLSSVSQDDTVQRSTHLSPANTGGGRISARNTSSRSTDFRSRNDTTPKTRDKKHFRQKLSMSGSESNIASRSLQQSETETSRGTVSRFSKYRPETQSATRSRKYQSEEKNAGKLSGRQTDKDAEPVHSHFKTETTTTRSLKHQNRKDARPGSSNSQTRNGTAQKPSKLAASKDQKEGEYVGGSAKHPGAKQTKLFIRVHQEFDNDKAFASFLDRKITSYGDKIQPIQDNVSFRNGFTFCTLICPSKTKAFTLMQNLKGDKRESDVQLDCNFREFPKRVNEKEHRQDQRNIMISETMQDFDKLSDRCVRDEMIRQLEQEQVDRQQLLEEFKAFRDQLKTQLQSVDVNDFSKDLKALRDRFKRDCDRMKAALPIYGKRREILQAVQENQVTIVLGETGSGKSTQLVQYLHESGLFQSGLIVCTQPRRVAATSLATRVAKKTLTKVGEEVGYQFGSKSKESSNTRILYTTDHSLLNECLSDPELRRYSCIIVDEAHERSLHTDLLLSMIKKCLVRRPDLRVIITSATIDPSVFEDFFGNCPVLEVTGRVFPVEVIWSKDNDDNLEEENYCEKAISTVLEIHTQKPEGDILVFVTSPAETEKCSRLLCEKLKSAKGAFKCFQLHGKQQPEEQQKVFQTLRRTRKIVFATNCAETSLTIDGIKYVVDTGLAKEMCYDPKRNLNALRVSLISQSSANQRKGRAGRTAPGKCYRLFSQKIFEDMHKTSLPEILRIHLGHALLKLAELGVDETSYDFVESPSAVSIENAVKMLESLGALEEGQITEKGRWIAKLPFDPRLGLLTYLGQQGNLLYDSIVLAAAMSAGGGVFYRGSNEQDQRVHDRTKTLLSTDKGDCLLALDVYRSWLAFPDKERSEWCREYGHNAKALRGVKDTVQEVCHLLNVDHASQELSEEDQTEELRKMIVTCYANNLCHHLGQENAGYFAVHDSCRVHIHPSSCLNALGCVPEWVVYDQLIQTSRDFIINVTPVDESWLKDLDMQALGLSVEDIRKKTVKKIASYCVGSRAFFNIVGPCYSRLRELESSFSASRSVIFIEANRDQSQVNVYSTAETDQTDELRKETEKIITQTVELLKQEVRERSIAGANRQDVRVVIGQGGQVEEVLMPDQTRKIFVKESIHKETDDRASEDTVRKTFGRFGDIQFCRQFDKGSNWGFLIFKTSEEAERAARNTEGFRSLSGELERREPPEELTKFLVTLKWCLRSCKGHAIVHVEGKFFNRCLRLRTLYVDTLPVTITAERGRWDHIRLHNITNAMTEDLIERTLLHALDQDEETPNVVLDIDIPRTEPVMIRRKDFEQIHNRIQDAFRPYLKTRPVVRVIRPDDSDDMFTAIIRFPDAKKGFTAFEKFKDSADIHTILRKLTRPAADDNDDDDDDDDDYDDDYDDDDDDDDDDDEPRREEEEEDRGGLPFYEMRPQATAKMHIPENAWKLGQVDVLEAMQDLDKDHNVNVTEVDDDGFLTIRASSLERVVRAKSYLDAALRGVVVECGKAPLLFSAGEEREGILKQMMDENPGARLEVDGRFRKVTIRGPRTARERMRQRIKDLIQVEEDSKEYFLRGPDKPAGLMKALLLKYEEHLTRFLQSTGLHNASLDFHRQKLKMFGCQSSLQRATEVLDELTEEIWQQTENLGRRPLSTEPTESCSVCLCHIQTGHLYRLQLCSHPYCTECFQQMVHYAIKDETIPIQCCQDGCQLSLALCDLLNLSRTGHIDLKDLTKAAVSTYVKTHSEEYRYCPTNDCPAIYNAIPALFGQSYSRPDRDIEAFVCPDCGESTCRICHTPTHNDKPCPTSDSDDTVLEEWAREDSANRKKCPKCRYMIERRDGCNKMTCKACKTIFCFVCCQSFASERFCYNHLVKKHGGIFPDNYGNGLAAERVLAGDVLNRRYRPLRRNNFYL